MFQEIMLLITLILALYGLAHVITFLALWLTAPVKGQPYQMLIRLRPEENDQATVINARERLATCGLLRSVQLIAVNDGLSLEKAEKAKLYCRGEQIQFCEISELPKILEITSFQKEENQV